MFHALFVSLTWWQVGLVILYVIYTIIRSIWIFNDGLTDALLGGKKQIKLYHLIWSVIDIPAILLGKFFPVLKKLFNVTLLDWEKKEEKK